MSIGKCILYLHVSSISQSINTNTMQLMESLSAPPPLFDVYMFDSIRAEEERGSVAHSDFANSRSGWYSVKNYISNLALLPTFTRKFTLTSEWQGTDWEKKHFVRCAWSPYYVTGNCINGLNQCHFYCKIKNICIYCIHGVINNELLNQSVARLKNWWANFFPAFTPYHHTHEHMNL